MKYDHGMMNDTDAFDDAGQEPTDEPAPSKCKCPSEERHTCPYAVEINDDEETLCDCCEECAYQCSMDI